MFTPMTTPTDLIEADRPRGAADVLTIGFATAVACWLVGYATHMVGTDAAGPVTAAGLLGCALVGGFIAGRSTHRGAVGGALAGLTTGLINLMILGSVLKPDAMHGLGLGGSVIVTSVVMGIAAFVGARFRLEKSRNWTHRFALVGVAATGVLLLSGGLVTGREAGLAVNDWPTSFGENMWLFPLQRMTGNIYYEHTHRLYGTLVGLTTVVLAFHLIGWDPRKWVKLLAIVAVVSVIAQGVMGGLRVTEATGGTTAIEVATLEDETASSAFLRVAHGTFAQIFFALMTALAVVTSSTWKNAERIPGSVGSTDRILSIALLLILTGQLILGARVRHLHDPVFVHIVGAIVVLVLAFAVGMRAWGLHGEAHPALRRLGMSVAVIVAVQLTLGFIAFGAKGMASHSPVPTLFDVVATTVHQFTGALLLAVATATCLLLHRLLAPGVSPSATVEANPESAHP